MDKFHELNFVDSLKALQPGLTRNFGYRKVSKSTDVYKKQLSDSVKTKC